MKTCIGLFGRTLSALLRHSPASVRWGLGAFLGWLWFDLFRIRRKIVLENITRAFPHLSEGDKVKLGRRSLMNLGHNFVDYCWLPVLNKGNFQEHFEFHNLELVDQGFAKNKGVLLLTLHLGHGDMACAGLSLLGYRVFMVSKFFKIQWLNDLWFGMRRRLGTEFIAPRNSTFPLLRALKANSLVILPLDQFTGPPIGVRTTFFGHETGTAAGLALMADRSEAEVIAAYTIRTEAGKHAVFFGPVMPSKLEGDRNQSLVMVTQQFNNQLEEFVKMHPEQWMWIHRRWKRFGSPALN